MNAIWIIVLLYPLVGAILAVMPGIPLYLMRYWMASAPLPALIAALAVPTGSLLELDVVLLGGALGLANDTARTFFLLTAGLWAIAGLFACAYSCGMARLKSYTVFSLLTYTGNVGIFLATDAAFFYTSFALMTFASAGLVLHNRSPEAVRAGVLYVVMAVVGEVLILTALFWMAFVARSLALVDLPVVAATSPWLIGCILFGFGVKAGLLSVHVWLPLAHPVAPTPASAVLSGAMVKAGIFGWLTFLPGGLGSFSGWSTFCILAGLISAFAAAYAGLTQRLPKATLAYSSISQLGLMTLAVGIGLGEPKAWPAVVGVVGFFAFNHAFAKGALFMADGAAGAVSSRMGRTVVICGALVAALAIAGFPLTGGEIAKAALKKLGAYATVPWGGSLEYLLKASALATTMLLAQFVCLLNRAMLRGHPAHRSAIANRWLVALWGLSVLGCLVLPWWGVGWLDGPAKPLPLAFDTLYQALPIFAGCLLAVLVMPRAHRLPGVPLGDLGLPLLWVGGVIMRCWVGRVAPWLERSLMDPDRWVQPLTPSETAVPGWLDHADRLKRHLPTAGIIILLLLIGLRLGLA